MNKAVQTDKIIEQLSLVTNAVGTLTVVFVALHDLTSERTFRYSIAGTAEKDIVEDMDIGTKLSPNPGC